ncbi:hypothetical protein EPN28_01165 [Patescibacteria group bacterium]|nr:MAG: hypothetical protein EPN28_01165 [Patescibacteria group bacterium]
MLKKILFLVVICGLIYANLAYWRAGWLGLFFLFIYLVAVQAPAFHVLHKFFNFPNAWRTRALAGFFAFAILGSMLGVIVVFARFTAETIALAFFANGLLLSALAWWAARARKNEAENFGEDTVYQNALPEFLAVVYFLLLAVGALVLYWSKTGRELASPWQTISPYYIYIFFAATFVLGLLIFSKLRAKTVLFLLVAHSLLLHAYLPLTHQLVYGADQWRHIASETRLIASGQAPAISAGLFSYSQLWGIEASLSRLFDAPLFTINGYLLPLAWSLIFPLLLFELAQALSYNKRKSLFFAWLGFLFFAWQAAGSFTLPNNFGFLVWLFLFLLLIKRINFSRREQIIVLAVAAFMSFFGYALYLILFLVAWALVEIFVWRRYSHLASPLVRGGKQERVWVLVLTFITAVFIIPAAEIAGGFARFGAPVDWLAQIKQMAGNFSAYFLANGPRPHDILGGNILFNQTPAYAFVENIFTAWRWPLAVFAILFFVFAMSGAFIIFRRRTAAHKWALAYLSGLFLSYLAVFYFFLGEKILTRRLDNVLALLFILAALAALAALFDRYKKPAAIVALVFILSAAMAASYSLGPDTRAMSADEYNAMRYVWENEKSEKKHCVLADTMPLLALEALSGKEIVGGGFPINKYFAQPERVELLKEAKENLNAISINKSLALTGADKCWIVGEFNLPDAKNFGKVNVGRYGK